MTKEEVLKTVLQSDHLPTLPTVASKLVSITSKEETSITEIADLISKDISLSSKILKMANSALYSFPNKIGTVSQAVSVMGTNAVRSLVLSFSFLKIKKNGKKDTFDYKQFWEKSIACAVSAKLIIENLQDKEPEEIFIAGLLQNIGELIIARAFPEKYEQIIAECSGNGISMMEAEQKIIGVDHAFVGYKVAENWRFPPILIMPIQYHHFPAQYKGGDKRIKLVNRVIHLSDILTNIIYSKRPREYHKQFKVKARLMAGFDENIIDNILHNVHKEIARIASTFDLKIKEPKPIEDILLEANTALSVLNLNYEQMNKELIAAKVQLQKLTDDLEVKNKRLADLANIDGLTEVYNHRYFQDFLEKEINRSGRNGSTLSLIISDVDNFKSFNDNYGHQTGDSILKEICSLMKNNLREYDLVARYGGEEFAIVLPDTNKDEAGLVAEKIRKIIDDHSFIVQDGKCHVTVSFGFMDITPAKDSFKKNDLIDFADQAMYESKKKGKNRVTPYTEKKRWFRKTRA